MTEEKAPSAGQRIRQSDPVVERLRLLTTVEERAELLSTLGIDVLIILPFGRPLAETQADRFIELLLEHLHMTGLWAGPNFALGHRREGNVPYLQRVGKERGFAVHVVEPLVWNGEAVSSSRVRAALERGDVDEATGCLGRPYRVAGIVARGDERGRRIGFPTANLSPPRERLIPSGGIYACLAHAGSETYPAAVSIGVRPTFPGVGDVTGPVLEAHLLDFCGDLYGRMLALDFFARLRDEWAFPSAAALAAQIREDVARVREILAGRRYCNPEISKE
jgi:riboflavin kinase/FMN adenylyltransferase